MMEYNDLIRTIKGNAGITYSYLGGQDDAGRNELSS